MTDPKAIDISPEAVAVRVARLYSLEERGWIDTGVSDFIIALAAARDEEVRERDALRSRDATRELLLKEAQANCDGLEEERDELAAKNAELRARTKDNAHD